MNDIPITIVGNVCTDPNMTPTTAGVPRATFRVASNPRRLKDGVWVDGDPTYVTVICFRSLAENVVASIGKGDPIVVTKLPCSTWGSGTGTSQCDHPSAVSRSSRGPSAHP